MIFVGKLEMGSDAEIIQRLNMETGGRVQQIIDTEVIEWCRQYVPFDEGVLYASAWDNTKIGSGTVIFNTPYAHYMYYGEVYGPNFQIQTGGEMMWRSKKNAPKLPTGRPLHYSQERSSMAGSFWFERMLADHKDDILEAAKLVAGAK